MNNKDYLQRFLFENTALRGAFVKLDTSVLQIMEQHQYPPMIRDLLSQVLVASVLLSANIKFKGHMIIQFQSQGPVTLLVAKCSDDLKICGVAKWDENASDAEIINNFKQGQLVVSVVFENQEQPYQSIIPLDGLSIAAAIEKYFKQSEQLETKLWFAHSDSAAGMMLQQMPESVDGKILQDQEKWSHVSIIGATLTNNELLNLDTKTLLNRLYHDEDVRLFDLQHIEFACTCSQEKMQRAVLMMSREEIDDILKTSKVVDVHCHFCNSNYQFDKNEIDNLT